MLAQGEVDPGLVLEADERQGAMEGRPRAGEVAGREAGPDVDQDLREAEAGHRPDRAASQLLEHEQSAQAAEDPDGRVGGEHGARLRRRRLIFQLQEAQPGMLAGQAADELRAHEHAARGRVVLDDDRQADGLGEREVVAAERRVVRPREGGRPDHQRPRPHRLGLAAEGEAAVGRGVGRADAHGHPAVRRLDRPGDDPLALRVGELARLAHDAQDRQTLDAPADDEVNQAPQARLVEGAVGLERRGQDRVDAAEVVERVGLMAVVHAGDGSGPPARA